MKKQRNMTKRLQQTSSDQNKNIEIYNLLNKELEIQVLCKLQSFEKTQKCNSRKSGTQCVLKIKLSKKTLNHKNNQIEVLEPKNSMNMIRNAVERINIRTHQKEQRISELEIKTWK